MLVQIGLASRSILAAIPKLFDYAIVAGCCLGVCALLLCVMVGDKYPPGAISILPFSPLTALSEHKFHSRWWSLCGPFAPVLLYISFVHKRKGPLVTFVTSDYLAASC